MTFNDLIPLLQIATKSESDSLLVLLQLYKSSQAFKASNGLINEYSPEDIERMYIANHKYNHAQIPCKHCGKSIRR
jgi:Fe2+ or Zn2+ uptake regulation protein